MVQNKANLENKNKNFWKLTLTVTVVSFIVFNEEETEIMLYHCQVRCCHLDLFFILVCIFILVRDLNVQEPGIVHFHFLLFCHCREICRKQENGFLH